MITEDYVSFEVAKLLKEKGFDIGVRYYYQKIDDDITYNIGDFRNWNVHDMWYSIPTLQMAMKWLREVHDIYIMIDKDFATENGWHYVVVRKHDWTDNIDKGLIQQESNSYAYEFACEAALKYSLENLI